MKRYKDGEEVEIPEIDAFLTEIEEVCKKHGLSIGHEDSEGGFTILEFDQRHIEWLKDASDWRV